MMNGMTVVTHQPRVARDAARAFVRITQTPYFDAFADHVIRRLGPDFYLPLEETRSRILDNLARTGGDRTVVDTEMGAWRIRMEELLRLHPDLIGTVMELTSMVPKS